MGVLSAVLYQVIPFQNAIAVQNQPDSPLLVFADETLTVNAGGAAARWLRITSDNSRLEEMTIQHGTVANEPATWSAVKTLYR